MRRWLIVLLALAALQSCRARPRDLVIFHTNDIHGHFVAEPASWRKDNALVGGMGSLEFHLDSLRRLYPYSLYLDAGDLMTGNPVCNIEYNAVKGGALLTMLHLLGVQAMCLGNHEFDLGAQHLRDFITAAPFPIVTANLRERDQTFPPLCKSHLLLAANGLKIAVIGLILDDLPGMVAKSAVEPFIIEDVAAVAQRKIDELDPESDLIILLTHQGVEDDSLLATRIRGADAIIGGHSHTRLEQPLYVNGVVIVQAGSHCRNLGMLHLTIQGDSVVRFSGKLVELVQPSKLPVTPLTTIADSLEAVINQLYGQVIGDLAEPWKRSYHTGSNVGNWICDRLCERYQADVALINAGGLRQDVQAGPITLLDVQQLLPFVNTVVTFEATGEELLKVAHEQARAQGLKAHGVLEMSGMSITYKQVGNAVRLISVNLGDHPLETQRKYRVVSIDYVTLSQPEKYLGFIPRDQNSTGELLSDVVADEIRKTKKPIFADGRPRLKEVQ